MSRSTHATSTGTITLKFTNDLPNGPYVVKESQTNCLVHISQNATLTDVKSTMENFAHQSLTEQAQNARGVNMTFQWTIKSFSYKGGPAGLETPLSSMKDGDQVTFTFSKHLNGSQMLHYFVTQVEKEIKLRSNLVWKATSKGLS